MRSACRLIYQGFRDFPKPSFFISYVVNVDNSRNVRYIG
nr:MAG TPA: hypothetical protein [Caudoviricetes sp.]